MGNNIIWIMGPTSSGKTSIATQLVSLLRQQTVPVIHYDGDEVRDFFAGKLGFSPEERLRVVSTIVYLANKARDAGLNVVVSALTANFDAREYMQEYLHEFVLVYLDCPIAKCAERDPKGLYRQALNSEINTLIGVNQEYLPPDNPDIVLNTAEKSLEESVEELLARIISLKKCSF